MNKFLPINNKKIGILGAARSGLAAAQLANKLGAKVFLSDIKNSSNIKIDGIKCEFGKHSDKILESDLIIKSPGIKNNSKIIKRINDSSIPIVSEIEFASWFTNGFIIALTGTNGKTTTVELINSILKNDGLVSFLGGNIGVPFSTNVLYEQDNLNNKQIFHVLEISSFQLEDIKYFKPNISIILNISPDHLDYHASFNDYLDAKLKITMNQDSDCHAIINERDILSLHEKSKAKQITFKVSKNNSFFIKDKKIELDIKNSLLKGKHNYENILSAFIACNLCGLNKKSIINSINTFKSLPHRLEKIAFKLDYIFYNDSKATNLHATCAAIDSLESNIVLILGGIDKNNTDFSVLKKYQNKIQKIILYGESRNFINEQIADYFDIYSYKNFGEAVNKSIKVAQDKNTVLLSPACASFDQFKNYEERGNYFKKIISNYYEKN
jgi:UDP-N-acetylmuramoylalanine--D-glutamate ligase